jgi:hypothetical protein
VITDLEALAAQIAPESRQNAPERAKSRQIAPNDDSDLIDEDPIPEGWIVGPVSHYEIGHDEPQVRWMCYMNSHKFWGPIRSSRKRATLDAWTFTQAGIQEKR